MSYPKVPRSVPGLRSLLYRTSSTVPVMSLIWLLTYAAPPTKNWSAAHSTPLVVTAGPPALMRATTSPPTGAVVTVRVTGKKAFAEPAPLAVTVAVY